MSIQLFGRTTSYNVQKVLWLLTELDLPFEHIECGGKYGGLNSEEFLMRNPFGKVPLLIDNGSAIRESNTILRYLAATYSKDHWWHQNSLERSKYEAWMDWSIDVLETAFVGVFWGYYRTPEPKRNRNHIEKNKQTCLRCLTRINEPLENNTYLCGANISLADIVTGVFIYRINEIDLDIQLPENVNRWYQTLQLRPGYKKHVMSDFSELKGRENY